MRLAEGVAQVISQTVQQVAKVASDAAKAAFKQSVAHAAAQPVIKGVAAGKSIDRVAGETGSTRLKVIAQLTVAGYDVKVTEPKSDNGDVRMTVIRDPSTGRTVTEYYDFQHDNYTTVVTEPGGAPTSSPLRDGLGRKVTTSFDAKTGGMTTRTEDDLGSGTVVESTRLADGTVIQKTTLKGGTSETMVTAPNGSTAKLVPGQDPTRQGTQPIITDFTAGKSIDQIAGEHGLTREQVIAQLRAAGYEVATTTAYTENGVSTTAIRDPITGRTITEHDYARNGTHDVSVTDPSGKETTTPVRDSLGRKVTTSTDATTGGVTTRTEDDLGSGTVIESTRLADGTTIEKTIPKGGKPQTVVTSSDGKKTVLAADQTPTRAGTHSIVQDLAQGKSIDQIAKEHGWTPDQVRAELAAAGLEVTTTEPTPDSTQTTIVDKHTGKIIANHHADYRHNTESTHYVDAKGNDVTKTVSTDGTVRTTVVGPEGRKTETTIQDGKTTTAVTFNGYTLTTVPDGSTTLTDNTTGTDLKLKKGSVEEAFAKTVVSINPNSSNPEEAKAAKVVKSLLDGIFAGEALPDLLKAAQQAGVDKDALVAKYGPGNGVPGVEIYPTRDDQNNVIDPYGNPPTTKAPSGGTWVAMNVDDKWYWVDSAVAKAITTENVAITRLGQTQAKSGQSQAQLDAYMLDPAYKGAVDAAQTTVNKVLARFDLEWRPQKPEGTLADAQTRLTQANTVFNQVTSARGEYETAAGILDKMIASGSALRPVTDPTRPIAAPLGTPDNRVQQKARDLADNAAVRSQFADINAHMSQGDGFMGDSMITLTGTADAPARTLPPGTQPVEITIGGRTIKVAPDVAKNYQATGNIDALTDSGKKIAIEVEVTNADGNKSKKWLWVDPDLALFKIQSDSQIEVAGAYSDFYKAHSLTAGTELTEANLKQKLLAEYNSKHQFLFEPGKEHSTNGGKYLGKYLGEESDVRDGELWVIVHFEKGDQKEQLTFGLNDKNVNDDYRDRPLNQEWRKLMEGTDPSLCGADGLPRLRTADAVAGRTLNDVLGKQIGFNIADLDKRITGLHGEYLTALTKYGAGSLTPPEGALPAGAQPVEVDVGGTKIKVAPDVAARLKQGESLVDIGQPVWTEIELTREDGSKYKEGRWVDPHVAVLQLQQDALQAQRTAMGKLGGQVQQFWEWHDLRAKHPELLDTENSTVEKTYLDEHQAEAVNAIYQPRFESLLGDDNYVNKYRRLTGTKLDETIARTLGQDKDSGAVGKVVDEIHGAGGDAPEVRVVPIFSVDDTVGTQQTALFAVKDGDKVVYVDANGQTFDDLKDFLDNNRQFGENGKLVVPTNLEFKAGPDGKVALDVVKARNVSTMDKFVDPIIGIGAGVLGVAGLFPTPASPFLLGAAAAGGVYLGGRAVVKEVDYLQHGGELLDGESLMNLGMVATVALPEVASILRTAGLSGRPILGTAGNMSRWQAFRATKGLVKPKSPLAATAGDYMRSTGSLNRTARGLDWAAIGTGAPLIGVSAHDLAEHGGDMSAFELATALTGLATGVVGTAAGVRGLVHTAPGGTPRRTAHLNYLEPGSVTVSGRVVDEGAVAVRVPEDAFLVIATKDGLVPVDEMAGDVSGHPDYSPGQDIVIMVCGAGTRETKPGAFVPTSYAGELGNKLGARVHAVDGRVWLGDTISLEGPAVTELPGLPLTDISGQNPRPQANHDAQQRFWLGDRESQIRVEEPFDKTAMAQGARVRGQPIDTMHLDAPAERPDPMSLIDQAVHLVPFTSADPLEAMRLVEPQLAISPDYNTLGLAGMADKWVQEIADGSRIAYVIYPAIGSRLPREPVGIISVHKEGLIRGDYRDLRPDVYEAEAYTTELNRLRNIGQAEQRQIRQARAADPTRSDLAPILSEELLKNPNYRPPTRQLPVGGKLDGTQELPLTKAQLEDLGEVWQFSTYLVTKLTSGRSAAYPSGMVNKPARMKLMTLVAEDSLRRGEGIPAFYSRIHAGGAYPVGADGVQIVVGEDGAAALISPDDTFHFTDADDGSRHVVWNDITRTISPDDEARYLKNPPTHPAEFNAASIGSQQSLTDSGPIAVGLEDSSPFPGQVRRFVAIFRVNPGHHVRADEGGNVVLDGPGAQKWLSEIQKKLAADKDGKWSGPDAPYAIDYSTLPEPVDPTTFSYTSGKAPDEFTYANLKDLKAGSADWKPVPQHWSDSLKPKDAYARYLREKEYYTPREMAVRYGPDGMQPPSTLDLRAGTTIRTRLNAGGGFGFGGVPIGSPTLRSRSFGVTTQTSFRALGQAARLSLEQGTTRPLKVTSEQELSLAVRPDEWRQMTATQWGVLPASNWTILPVFGTKLIGLAKKAFFGEAEPGWKMDIHTARVIGVTPGRVFRAGPSGTKVESVNISTLPLSNSMPEGSGHVIEIDFHLEIVAPKRDLDDGELDFFGGTAEQAPNGHVELQSSIPYDRVMQDIRVAPYLPGITKLLDLWKHTKGIPVIDIGGESITFTPGFERRQQILLNDSVGKGDVVPAELTEQFNAAASGSTMRLQVTIKAPEGSDPTATYVSDFLENPTVEGLRTLVEKGYVDPDEAMFFLPENGSNFHQTAIPGKPLTTTITDLTGRTYDVPDPSTSNLWMIFNDRWSLGNMRFSPDRAIASSIYKAKQKIGDLLPGDGPRRVASPHQLPVKGNILDAWYGAKRERADPSFRFTLLAGLPYFRYGPLAWNAEIRGQYGKEAPPVAPAVRDGEMVRYPLSRDGSGTVEVPAWFVQCIEQVLAGPTPVIPKGGTAQINTFLTKLEAAYPEQSATVALFRQEFMSTGMIGDGKHLRRADARAMVEMLPGLRLDGGDPQGPGGPQLPPAPQGPQGPQGSGPGAGPRSLSDSPPGGWEPVSSSQSVHLEGDDPSLGPPYGDDTSPTADDAGPRSLSAAYHPAGPPNPGTQLSTGRRADLNYLGDDAVTVGGQTVDPKLLELGVSPDVFLVVAREGDLPDVGQLALDIATHPDYRPGQDVVLYVCGAGNAQVGADGGPVTSYASILGNGLGARVHAVDGTITAGNTITLDGRPVTALPGLPLTDISSGHPHAQANYGPQNRFWLQRGGRQPHGESGFEGQTLTKGATVDGKPIDPLHLGALEEPGAIRDWVPSESDQTLVVGSGHFYRQRREGEVFLDVDPVARPDILSDIRSAPIIPEGHFQTVQYEGFPYPPLLEQPSQALAETYRVMKPGGSLEITTGLGALVDRAKQKFIVSELRQTGLENVRAWYRQTDGTAALVFTASKPRRSPDDQDAFPDTPTPRTRRAQPDGAAAYHPAGAPNPGPEASLAGLPPRARMHSDAFRPYDTVAMHDAASHWDLGALEANLTAAGVAPETAQRLITQLGEGVEKRIFTPASIRWPSGWEQYSRPYWTPEGAYASPDAVSLASFVDLASGLGVPSETAAALYQPLPRDDVTAFYDARISGFKVAEVERAQDYVLETGQPAFFVSADIANLGGLNHAMRNRLTEANVHYGALARLFHDHLAGWADTVVPLRIGGDEIGAVVVGVDEPGLRAAIDEVNSAIQIYVRDNGLSDIANPKRPEKRGLGIHIGFAEILPDLSPNSIFNKADLGVDASKNRNTSNVAGEQRRPIGTDRPDAGTTPVAYRGTGAEIPGGATSSQGQIGGSAGKDGTSSPNLELNLTPVEQRARRFQTLNAFVDANLLYSASTRFEIPTISVAVTDPSRFSAFGRSMTPHEFLLHDEVHRSWLGNDAHGPLVLDILNPSPAGTALAQRLSNVSGADIIVPTADAPTQWQLLRPAYTGEGHPSGIVELSADGTMILVQGGERRAVQPSDLGQLLNVGVSKTAFRLYDKVLLVHRQDSNPQIVNANNPIDRQIDAANMLRRSGAPYLTGIDGRTRLLDLDATLMDFYPGHSIEAGHETPSGEIFYTTDISLINSNSLSSLRVMRNFYTKMGIGVDDPQFMVDREGFFYLSDFSWILPSNTDVVAAIDRWIELAEAVVQNRQNPGSPPH